MPSELAVRIAEKLTYHRQAEFAKVIHSELEPVRKAMEFLEEIAIALNDWYAERMATHESNASVWREYQKQFYGDGEPWVFAEQLIKKSRENTLDPISTLMRKAEHALSLLGESK